MTRSNIQGEVPSSDEYQGPRSTSSATKTKDINFLLFYDDGQ
jgi:hypothetical protein